MTDDAADPDPLADDPELSDEEAPQAMHLFTEPTEPDVRLDRDHPAFDRVQQGKAIDDAYEREYNRRYVREHGDHQGLEPTEGEEAEARRADARDQAGRPDDDA